MRNIESVVHERNDAYYRLETGEGASPPLRTVTSFMGFTYKYVIVRLILKVYDNLIVMTSFSRKQAEEHLEPPTEGRKEYEVPYLDDDAYMMQKLWAEKEFMKERDR